MKYAVIISLLFLAGCASVAGVEVSKDDTAFTILTATVIAVVIFVIKGFIEYQFAKKLEKYKRQLDKK